MNCYLSKESNDWILLPQDYLYALNVVFREVFKECVYVDFSMTAFHESIEVIPYLQKRLRFLRDLPQKQNKEFDWRRKERSGECFKEHQGICLLSCLWPN